MIQEINRDNEFSGRPGLKPSGRGEIINCKPRIRSYKQTQSNQNRKGPSRRSNATRTGAASKGPEAGIRWLSKSQNNDNNHLLH